MDGSSSIMLSEISQEKKDKSTSFHLYVKSKNKNGLIETETEEMVTRKEG